ncbi:hypothetical protein BC835DRAFT_1373151 [Cytidiella melzeri]|nr:hypothetical protein BC835DRAFT_1373151 [Cytidiella melzeri]
MWQKKRGRRDSAGSSAPVLPIAAHSSSPRASEAQPFANTTPVALALAPAVEVTPVAVLPPCLPPSTTSTSAQPPSTQRLLYKAIQKKWAELQSKPPSPPPQTFLELERRLDPVMKFHDALERGDYAPMGFVPSTRYRGEGEVEDDDDELMDLDDE